MTALTQDQHICLDIAVENYVNMRRDRLDAAREEDGPAAQRHVRKALTDLRKAEALSDSIADAVEVRVITYTESADTSGARGAASLAGIASHSGKAGVQGTDPDANATWQTATSVQEEISPALVKTLSADQLDGQACIVCGSSDNDIRPAGRHNGIQLFACLDHDRQPPR